MLFTVKLIIMKGIGGLKQIKTMNILRNIKGNPNQLDLTIDGGRKPISYA